MFASKSFYFRLSSSKMMFTKLVVVLLSQCTQLPLFIRFLCYFFHIHLACYWQTTYLHRIFLQRHMRFFHSLSEAHSEQLTIFAKHSNLKIWHGSEYTSDPVDIGSKLNVHKTFRRRPGRPLNVLCTFNLRFNLRFDLSKAVNTFKYLVYEPLCWTPSFDINFFKFSF